MSYSDYQNKVASEKLVLATLDASKRLMGWSVHAGSVYKLENVSYSVISSIVDSGSTYTAVASIAAIDAGSKYYLDRDAKIIYLRASDSSNPNSRFLVGTFRLFFANLPIALPYDLASGFEVLWEPWIKSKSEFGVEIDTINQTSDAIEGSGSLTLINEQSFWSEHFDKLTFENKECSIYSYNRDIDDPTQAQLLFKGKVEKRSYKALEVSFSLKDSLAELKAPVALSYIESLALRHDDSVAKAYQRMIFGRVFGFQPTNIDEVKDGYPIAGTVALENGSPVITGTGTSFLSKLSRDDNVVIAGVEYTIASVTSNTVANLTENYTAVGITGVTLNVYPNVPKRWTNRVWKVAGHALCQPTTTTLAYCTPTRIRLTSTTGMFAGDEIYIGALGAGELVTISSVVSSNLVQLATSVLNVPAAGVAVTRPAIQNLKINDLELRFYRDYTVDATNGTFTLNETAEGNAAPIHQMSTTLAFTNGLNTVSGTGLDAIFKAGDLVSCLGQTTFFEILDVAETQLTLRTNATFTLTAIGLYKNIILDTSSDVVSCDVLGRTSNGLSTGSLIRNGPEIVKTLLTDAGLTAIVDTASFTLSSDRAPQDIGLVIPEKFNETKLPTYKDVINIVNRSILGNLVQTNGYQLSYFIIEPLKSSSSLSLKEADILNFSVEANAQNMIKTVTVDYRPNEYNPTMEDSSFSSQTKSSSISTYILKTSKEKRFPVKLVEESDARILVNRWAFILEHTSGLIKLTTRLQAANVEVGDVIDIEHRKLFVRFGGSDSRRLVLVQKVSKNGYDVEIEAVDLSNAFNRCANVTTNTHATYAASATDAKLIGGYITDNYGMQSNAADTFGTNLIW